jgi:SAM-dependent methyltransferase
MVSPLRLYADGLAAPQSPTYVRLSDGTEMRLAVERYLNPADATDEWLLRDVRGPVLDVGCGPGRHLHALAKRGVFALGVDLSDVAVGLARDGGANAIVGSIFDDVPGAGTWRTALLLDGNIGIGGAPARLLGRVSAQLRTGGRILVELEPPQTETRTVKARLETATGTSGWFSWARVGAADIATIAHAAGLQTASTQRHGQRWFATLRRPESGH